LLNTAHFDAPITGDDMNIPVFDTFAVQVMVGAFSPREGGPFISCRAGLDGRSRTAVHLHAADRDAPGREGAAPARVVSGTRTQ